MVIKHANYSDYDELNDNRNDGCYDSGDGCSRANRPHDLNDRYHDGDHVS